MIRMCKRPRRYINNMERVMIWSFVGFLPDTLILCLIRNKELFSVKIATSNSLNKNYMASVLRLFIDILMSYSCLFSYVNKSCIFIDIMSNPYLFSYVNKSCSILHACAGTNLWNKNYIYKQSRWEENEVQVHWQYMEIILRNCMSLYIWTWQGFFKKCLGYLLTVDF